MLQIDFNESTQQSIPRSIHTARRFPAVSFRSSSDEHNGAGTNPKAYLKILFFDERFQFVEEGSTSLRVSEAGSANAMLTLTNIKEEWIMTAVPIK